MSTLRHSQQSPGEVGGEVVEAGGVALHAVELAPVVLGGLLVTPPLLILAVVVVVPAAVILALAGAAFGVVAAPTVLFRRVRAHHRDHGTTLFIHRLAR